MAAELFLLPFRPALTADGIPVVGATLYFYATGTSTPQAVFADEGLTVSLGYIVEANAVGAWPSIYLDKSKIYRAVLRDAEGVPLAEADPYLAGVVDTLAPEVASNAAAAAVSAANAEAAALILSLVNGGYFEEQFNPPPADAAEGQTYLARENGRAALMVNFGGVGQIAFELTTITSVALALQSVKSAPVTDRFIANVDGAVINRLGDRVFIGAANANSGNYPNDDPDEQDWYTQYEREQGRSNGIIVSSQMAVLTNDYFGAAIGGVFAAQTKHFISGVGGAIGLEAHVVNNNTVTAHDAWALYSEATRDSEGVGAIITYEADARNKGSYHAITPYQQHPKQSVVHQVASGGALDGTGCEDVSAGINFRDNPTKFGAGIVFGNNSIRGTDGTTGYGNAILSALGHRHTWVNPAGERTGWITATATTMGAASGIEFSELGLLMLGPSDTTLARVRSVINAVNYLDITPGVSGQAVQIGVASTEANVGLFLSAKGTGSIIMSPDAVRNYANDAAAASGGVPVGGLYHVAGDVRIRIA